MVRFQHQLFILLFNYNDALLSTEMSIDSPYIHMYTTHA